MPQFRKNKWLSLFLEMVQMDLKSIKWDGHLKDSLSREERKAIKELREARGLIIKRSDMGVNVVLLK